LVAAVCQNPEKDTIQSIDIDINFVLKACHNLIAVDQELQVCRFLHASITKYFEENHWNSSQTNGHVAKVCLLLLNDSGHQENNPVPAKEQDNNNGVGEIIQYARLHWATHVQKHGNESIDDRVSVLLKKFLGSMNESGPAYRSWHKMITPLFNDRTGAEFDEIPLYGLYRRLTPSSFASFGICSFGFDTILTDWWVSGFADVNQPNDNSESLLQLAAAGGFVSITKKLLQKHASIDGKDKYGRTALYEAVANGNEAVVQLLLKANAATDIKTNRGWTGLCEAAADGHEAIVNLLLEANAKVETKDVSGMTALYHASQNGHEAIVKLLLEANAEVDAKDVSGITPLHQASQNGSEAIVKLLLEAKANVDTKDVSGMTALHRASQNGHESVVQVLLQERADVHAKSFNERTALHGAAAKGHDAVVRLLLVNDASVDAQDISRVTPLHQASHSGYEAIVEQLLDTKADVKLEDDNGRTALHEAAEKGHQAVAWLLLRAKANFDAKDTNRDTALHLATSNGYPSVVQLLLEAGADFKSPGHSLLSPEQLAVSKRENAATDDEKEKYKAIVWFLRAADFVALGLAEKPLSSTKAKEVHEKFKASVVHFLKDPQRKLPHQIKQVRISKLIHGQGITDPRVDGKYLCRWIHLPANNVMYCLILPE
jgi:ankyrin repeat protein